jgi:hypothetical protein
MRLWRLILGFVIYFFVIITINSMISLGKWVSLGNLWIERGYWVLMILLAGNYLLLPLLSYLGKPSVQCFERMLQNDIKATRKVWKHLNKTLTGPDKDQLALLTKDQYPEIRAWARQYMIKQAESFDGVIKQYAIRLTATVMISPNSFIDGITILYGNSKMIHTLSSKVNLRYSWKDLLKMYFSVMSVASVSGLIEEFDEVIEEMFTSLIEEFREFIAEESGKTISDSIPLLNILVKTLSPVLQAAGNYAFVLYNGKQFKYTLLNMLNDTKLSEEAIKKTARREARKAKYKYIEEMLAKMSLSGSKAIQTQIQKKKRRLFNFGRSSD